MHSNVKVVNYKAEAATNLVLYMPILGPSRSQCVGPSPSFPALLPPLRPAPSPQRTTKPHYATGESQVYFSLFI